MTDATEGRVSGAEVSPTEQYTDAASTAATTSPRPAHSEASSPGGSSSGGIDQESDLLKRIKDLADTQKALKQQKKQCAAEMKNALKWKKRLSDKATRLSDADLLEVLRMRKAKKDSMQPAANTPPPEDSQLAQ